MTTFFMISGYGFTVLKVFIFFILLHAVYPTFKYRYALLISCVAAPFYTQINNYLLYTMLSILLYILILFIGGCILVRKNFFVLILLSTFYVLMAGCIELFYITMMLNFSRHGARFFYVLLSRSGLLDEKYCFFLRGIYIRCLSVIISDTCAYWRADNTDQSAYEEYEKHPLWPLAVFPEAFLCQCNGMRTVQRHPVRISYKR